MAVPEGYTLLKEGQATILQHGNDVFYNPAQVIAHIQTHALPIPTTWKATRLMCFARHLQVINRDLSIAVLRYFVQQRREEIAAGKIRRIRRLRLAALPAAAAASAPKDSAVSATGEQASAPAGAGTEAQNSSAAVPASGSSGATGAAGDSGGALDPDIRILEGLAASGLRSIRYALEVLSTSWLERLFCRMSHQHPLNAQ